MALARRTDHTFSRVVKLDPPVRWDPCDECGKLEHVRPYMDMLVCDGCRASMMLEDCWSNFPDDAA